MTRPSRALFAGLTLGLLALAGCAETQLAVHAVKKVQRIESAPVPGGYKLGQPYQVAGVWYYPNYEVNYDETGVASWYGPKFHGRPTANGERFDMNAISAAHQTLPMPSRVRVTNLENGRALVVRVNDRGPFINGRIIDMSRRGAQLLGFHRNGTAKVRVEFLGLDDLTPLKPVPETTMVASNSASSTASDLPTIVISSSGETVVKDPKPHVSTEQLPAVQVERSPATNPIAADIAPVQKPREGQTSGSGEPPLYIEVAAFKTRSYAYRLADRVSSLGESGVTPERVGNQMLYRVRLGPLGSTEQADAVLAHLIRAGFTDSQIVVAWND
jgi:rare lipoprotein A